MIELGIEMISIEGFRKIELRVARVLEAEKVEGSEKLLRLKVCAGDKNDDGSEKNRQILAGIAKSYNPDDLAGKEIIIVANLEPRLMMGMESEGMLLAAKSKDGEIITLSVEKEVEPGAQIS